MNSSSKTDWKRIDEKTDAEIDTSEIPPLDASFFSRAKLRVPDGSVVVPVVLDPDILEWFRAQGGAYQQRMAAALRIYVEAHRHAG